MRSRSCSTSAACPICRTGRKAPAHRPRYAGFSCAIVSIFRLARRSRRGASRNLDPLASGGLEAVLAMEVSARPALYPEGLAESRSAHGSREPKLGRGTHCKRAPAETRHPGFSAHCPEVFAAAPARKTERPCALVNLPAPSRPSDYCVRFRGRGHCYLPSALRLHHVRAWQSPSRSLQCHGSSDDSLDATAAARGGWRRPRLPIPPSRSRPNLRRTP